MSLVFSRNRSVGTDRTPWTSVAFVVESMILLVCLVGSLAILTQLFSSSLNRSVESRTLDAATIAATSIAEHFAADPQNVDRDVRLGDLLITCDVTPEKRANGTLYKANIRVFDTSTAEMVYQIDTARYESGVR